MKLGATEIFIATGLILVLGAVVLLIENADFVTGFQEYFRSNIPSY